MKFLRMNAVLEDVGNDEMVTYDSFRFSGGEFHIKLIDDCLEGEDVTIEWYATSPSHVVDVAMASDALRRAGAASVSLLMPYVPFSRQDRVMVKGEPLSVKVFAGIVNSLGFDKVYTLDNHSPVTTALIENCVEINRYRIMTELLRGSSEGCVLISPDAGASKKTYEVAKTFQLPVVACSKRRDVRNGDIVGLDIGTSDLHGADCYVIDDICDGGRTFLEIAKRLEAANCGDLHLYVSHGIFSKGQDELSAYYSTIRSTMLKPKASEVPIIKTIPLRKEDLR